MKSFVLIVISLLTACTDVSKACPPFSPFAPFTSPELSNREREMLEVNGEYAAYDIGLICGSTR